MLMSRRARRLILLRAPAPSGPRREPHDVAYGWIASPPAALAQLTDLKGSKDYPMVSRYAGSVITADTSPPERSWVCEGGRVATLLARSGLPRVVPRVRRDSRSCGRFACVPCGTRVAENITEPQKAGQSQHEPSLPQTEGCL